MNFVLAGCGSIYKRELKAFFQSASAYVALGLFFLICGAIFHDVLVIFSNDSASAKASPLGGDAPNITVSVIEQTFQLLAGFILFIIPILTMRLIAAEKSSGTFEVLATCPIGDWSILLGKYFALVTVGAVLVVLSSIYPITAYLLGRSQGAIPDPSVVSACYLGLFLIFSTYAAFGLMASALTSSQVTSAIITLIGLLFWNIMADFPVTNPLLQGALNALSASRHTQNFMAGLLSAGDLAFYILASSACLFVAARALESRRWKI